MRGSIQRLRALMKERSLQKDLGCSSMNNEARFHVFRLMTNHTPSTRAVSLCCAPSSYWDGENAVFDDLQTIETLDCYACCLYMVSYLLQSHG
ncbi:hypothetical protein IFM89_027616 [Coptis chinensis]|uniref:Uncharacterized protein n=1 Tax=Coptis chinensis TaxID=261450 RepID=A0A835IS98_9MAGN|nr:hypothetical protein IFM89_027616 [Coptis chinensis]